MSKSTGCRNEPSTSENDTMTMRMRFLFAALTLALAAGSCSREPRTELFNGRDLAGWVCVTDPEGVGDARDAFSVQNGNIRIAGSPFGYMRTEETYDDYRLHVEWRWIGEATNSGIFQRVQAGDRLWPEAVECQLQAGRAGDLLGLGGAKIAGAESNGRVFIKPRSGGECERPAGEWNCAEIVCVGDHIAVCVNGVLQNEGDWQALHEQAVGDIVVAHSWFRTLSGLDYAAGFSAERILHEYEVALNTVILAEQDELTEPIRAVIASVLGLDTTSLQIVNRPPTRSKPIYMKVWEARKADGLDYDPEDERQQAFLSEITKYNIRSIE